MSDILVDQKSHSQQLMLILPIKELLYVVYTSLIVKNSCRDLPLITRAKNHFN